MERRIAFTFAIWIACGVVNARPQLTTPSIAPNKTSNTVHIRRPIYLLRPNGELVYFPGGLPLNLNLPIALPMSIDELTHLGLVNRPTSTPGSASLANHTSTERSMTTNPHVASTKKTTTSPKAIKPTGFPTVVQFRNPLPVSVDVNQPSTSTPIEAVSVSSNPTTLDSSKGDYSFQYNVNNKSTGDIKSQKEKRVDGVVTGYYMLMETDGTFRKVSYTADAQHGFRASVEKLPRNTDEVKY